MVHIKVNENIILREDEIEERFIHSPGPGGQHVNKAATGVQLRYNLRESHSLPEPVRERLIRIAGKRVNKDGVLIIEAHTYRSLERNRQDARRRLVRFILQAVKIPKRRKKSRPPRASVERRLEQKRHLSEKKKDRRSPDM